MPSPETQSLIDLYIDESRHEGIPPSEVGVDNWIEARLAISKYEDAQGLSNKHVDLIEDWELFKQTLQG